MEYGYIENGVLHSNDFDADSVKALDENWLPVDDIDYSQTVTDEGYVIEIVPYINGKRISYRYEKRFDKKAVRRQILELKAELTDGDYQIIKCYEASLTNAEMPYNIEELHNQRQQIRDKINELETKLDNA